MTPSLTLLARFQQQTDILIEVHFGPSGLLRERIEGGESCSVFDSADRQRFRHRQRLNARHKTRGCLDMMGSAAKEESLCINVCNEAGRNG